MQTKYFATSALNYLNAFDYFEAFEDLFLFFFLFKMIQWELTDLVPDCVFFVCVLFFRMCLSNLLCQGVCAEGPERSP